MFFPPKRDDAWNFCSGCSLKQGIHFVLQKLRTWSLI
jgi:hypothetical protein